MKLPIGFVVCLMAGSAVAQNVVPNAWENTPGTSTFLYMVTSARSYQYLINENQLTGLVGQNLNGLQMRLPTSATGTWPPANVTFNNFEIYIGAGVTPSARSLTFASNYLSTPTQVRSGSLNFASGSFTNGGTPVNAWGPMITFSDYLYTGGHLTIEMRHDGMLGTTTTRSFDANSTSTSGYLTDYAALWTGSFTPVTGSAGNFFITRINSSPVPEPLTLASLGLGVGLLARRRRKRS